MTYAGGSKHIGEYKDGKRHGYGTYTWSNGDEYVGGWKDGKQHGLGAYDSDNGGKYVGEYWNGERLSPGNNRPLTGTGTGSGPQYSGFDRHGKDDFTDGPLSDDWDGADWEEYMSGPNW